MFLFRSEIHLMARKTQVSQFFYSVIPPNMMSFWFTWTRLSTHDITSQLSFLALFWPFEPYFSSKTQYEKVLLTKCSYIGECRLRHEEPQQHQTENFTAVYIFLAYKSAIADNVCSGSLSKKDWTEWWLAISDPTGSIKRHLKILFENCWI